MTIAPPGSTPRTLPPVIGRLLSGTFWLALRTPIQAVLVFFSVPLALRYIGPANNGAYVFAWGFGFLQFLLEFGMSSALQRQVSDRWTRGDRDGVNRSIACGMVFYALMAAVQASALLGIAYFALPHTQFEGEPYRLIVKLLWLQALSAPCYGLSMVVSSVLQAARRYDFIPRLEVLIVILRFLALVAGIALGVDFFWIVVAQTALQIGLSLGPALWVMVRELGYLPHFQGARLSDFKGLVHISFYVFLIQLSVVLADKIDTTVLGFALREDAGPAITIYQVVSKAFLQIRQTGWMLAYLVMPAVASLAAAGDEEGLERIEYDGTRLLVGLLLPVTLLAAIYAHPFLALWIDPKMAAHAPLMQLFLVATIPLVISVLVQVAIGMNKIEVIALAALGGSLVNLPVSYVLTRQFGVSGVIWGTVLTTLISNLLVPGLYVFRALKIRAMTFLVRTLSAPLAGSVALGLACWILLHVFSPEPAGATWLAKGLPLVAHLTLGCLAYTAGYALVPAGRGDLRALKEKLRRKKAMTDD